MLWDLYIWFMIVDAVHSRLSRTNIFASSTMVLFIIMSFARSIAVRSSGVAFVSPSLFPLLLLAIVCSPYFLVRRQKGHHQNMTWSHHNHHHLPCLPLKCCIKKYRNTQIEQMVGTLRTVGKNHDLDNVFLWLIVFSLFSHDQVVFVDLFQVSTRLNAIFGRFTWFQNNRNEDIAWRYEIYV